MNDNISFEYLADCPEYIGACAAWIYGRWSLQDVYLKSGSAAGFYLTMGYEVLEIINTRETGAGTMTLLKKKLCVV